MLKHIIQTEGIISLYRSLPITLIMNVPQAAFFMTIYENLKSYVFSDKKIGLAGYSELSIKYVGCTKPECQTFDENSCKKPRYCTIRGTVKLIIQEDGFKAFYRGVIPRMLFVLPGAAVSWSTYEYIKSLLA